MALRGIGAKSLSERGKIDERPIKPWELDGQDRADRVIAFCEDLPITAGKLAGSQMELREWQRDFIRDVYAVNDAGERPVRTVVPSLARKTVKPNWRRRWRFAIYLGRKAKCAARSIPAR